MVVAMTVAVVVLLIAVVSVTAVGVIVYICSMLVGGGDRRGMAD